MLGRIIWKETGDEIVFSVTFPDLFEYWIDQINTANVNSFECRMSRFDPAVIERLKNNLTKVEKISTRIPLEIDEWHGDVLEQDYLNKLHRQWVKTSVKYPNLPNLLRSFDRLDVDFRDINNNIHALENSFVYKFVNYGDSPYQVENIFGTKILGFDRANLSLGFDNLGRSSWEKFRNLDDNIYDTDTNNFEMLSGKVDFTLQRPWSDDPPVEYINWCNQKGVPVVGTSISLGNIKDLTENIASIRKILIRNTNEQSNKFFFEICS